MPRRLKKLIVTENDTAAWEREQARLRERHKAKPCNVVQRDSAETEKWAKVWKDALRERAKDTPEERIAREDMATHDKNDLMQGLASLRNPKQT